MGVVEGVPRVIGQVVVVSELGGRLSASVGLMEFSSSNSYNRKSTGAKAWTTSSKILGPTHPLSCSQEAYLPLEE